MRKSARDRRLAELKKISDDLERRRADLMSKRSWDRFRSAPRGSEDRDRHIDELGGILEQQDENRIQQRVLESLPKTGRPTKSAKAEETARSLARDCLNAADGRARAAKRAFIKRICVLNGIGSDHAKNLWYAVTEPYGLTRRVR
jgi:hypothetical protein